MLCATYVRDHARFERIGIEEGDIVYIAGMPEPVDPDVTEEEKAVESGDASDERTFRVEHMRKNFGAKNGKECNYKKTLS